MKQLTVETAGRISKIESTENAQPAGTVRVRVKYAGVGFADVMAVRGGYALAPKKPFSPGYEFFGTVESVLGAETSFAPGDRVVGMTTEMGCYKDVLDLPTTPLVPVPAGVSDETAAAIPLNYLTAMALIEEKGKVKPGDTCLIFGGAGGVGSAVIELGRNFGITVYGGGSPLKQARIAQLGGIPFNPHTPDWVDEIKQQVPNGVAAAFDAFGGDSRRGAWRLVAPGGILVSYGFSPTIDGGTLPMLSGLWFLLSRKLVPNGKRTGVCGTPGIIKANNRWYRDAMARVLAFASDDKLSPHIHEIFLWSDVDAAHEVLIRGDVMGKVLLRFS